MLFLKISVLIEKPRFLVFLGFLIVLIMEWSFRGWRSWLKKEIYLYFNWRFKQGHTLAWVSVLKEKKKEETYKIVSFAVAVVVPEALQRHSDTGTQSGVWGTVGVPVTQTEDFPNCTSKS